LQVVANQQTRVTLEELAPPFADSIIEHIQFNDRQGNSMSSQFLDGCRAYLKGEITKDALYDLTEKYGFVNVVDAFQNVNGETIPNSFYEKDYQNRKREIVITDNLLKIKELFQHRNLEQEVEARWRLVETAWNLRINPNVLEVQHDEVKSVFFIQHSSMRRTDVTSVRDSLNGYQKGKCFYSMQDISLVQTDEDCCEVDHFLPHSNKIAHLESGANIDGVWNLVLAHHLINGQKSSKVPEIRYLERLYNRNEFFIDSKHPLAETIINQTGRSREERRRFLAMQYQIALNTSIHRWHPSIELIGAF